MENYMKEECYDDLLLKKSELPLKWVFMYTTPGRFISIEDLHNATNDKKSGPCDAVFINLMNPSCIAPTFTFDNILYVHPVILHDQ